MDQYLAGYTKGAQVTQAIIRRVGWARAKGWVKRDIRQMARLSGCGPCSPMLQGFTDAQLDSLN